jgi:hypothetical protein
MDEMSGTRRVRATWLLLVALTSVSLGVCTIVLAASGMACCEDLGDGHAAFTNCCSTGEQTSSSDLPVMVRVAAPSAETALHVTLRTAADDAARLQAGRRVPLRSVDPQALLSTFLI